MQQEGNFYFLAGTFAAFYKAARKAETFLQQDEEACAIFCRKALEEMVIWMFDHDRQLETIHSDEDATLNILMHKPGFIRLVGQNLFTDVNIIRKTGNLAVHVDNKRKVTTKDAYTCLLNLHAFAQWLASYYGDTIYRDPFRTSKIQEVVAVTAPIQELALIPLAEANVTETQDGIVYHRPSEKLTRELYIDILLKEAGWSVGDGSTIAEYNLKFSANGADKADYVLLGRDGTPLAVVEAKKTSIDGKDQGLGQGKRYADALEKQFGKRPVIFVSNGFEHYIWDDTNYPYRQIQGFYSKEDLEKLINRRITAKPLSTQAVNTDIAGRHYQIEAIQRAKESLEAHKRDLLFIMATGSGKTRTAAALVDVLIKTGRVKRVLFLADRTPLVSQAKNNFNAYLPQLTSVNLTKEKTFDQMRMVFSTYQTMINQIDEQFEGDRRLFTVGYFDLVIFDEVHRSIYQKYKAIFNYFDAIRLGLTATPKAETQKDTYELFHCETGVPTFSYELNQAVSDKFLRPPLAMKVPLKFPRHGIKYAELSDEEKQRYEDTFAENSDYIPDQIDSAALNEWLFNTNTVNKVLQLLMINGLKVNNGDTIGKTIIFAKNQNHAKFIESCFNQMYPMLKGHFLEVVTYASDKPENTIDLFKQADKLPQIVVSVDMLDTGIDVPEILNLVFFKEVKSSAKYWQMVGRGTRLCPDVFGPGLNKENFYIFDYCGNIEFFGDNPNGVEPSASMSLTQRIFLLKIKLAVTLEPLVEDDELCEYRAQLLNELCADVSALSRDSFVNRPHLRLIEQFSNRDYWNSLIEEKVRDLQKNLAPLVMSADTDFDARKFDSVIYRLTDAYLKEDKQLSSFIRLVKNTAVELLKQTTIPQVAAKKKALQSLLNETYWQNVTVQGLESLREDIRSLMKFIEKQNQPKVYSDFEDELTGEIEVVDIIGPLAGLATYNQRVASFIRKHANYIAINKIKHNEPISTEELEQVKQLLFTEDPEAADHLEEVLSGTHFIQFVRSIIGLDVQAAKSLFADFINREGISAEQITFIDTLINYLSVNGTIDRAMLFDRPFTDINHQGILGVFKDDDALKIIDIIDDLNGKSNIA
ncbi:DEAD/DEAH box helicase family protein [Mucilaginibacter sp. 21P]|uniref:DEAD/DEAH box helicase family protein n=1 Tax=Mucilaginibacter sp. 21P TaxID=2778902 RepID=UPI001C57E177|nr:DEAD/DEAH box helicase family protein [Mucilaginibacter sp. 21P]QXV66316.1 DEAD/DEAH box helicase family protein [Mucilaginibacter sp. 21P]